MQQNGSLTGKQKTLVALAAAMGGGCRTCAERLYSVAQTVEATSDEIERAFADGLRQRDRATEVMRGKAASLLGRVPRMELADSGTGTSELSKLAASVALNSAPDALRHRRAAESGGVTQAEVGVAIGTARTIRSKAQGFSDEEVGDVRYEEVLCSDPPSTSSGCCGEGETTETGKACCG